MHEERLPIAGEMDKRGMQPARFVIINAETLSQPRACDMPQFLITVSVAIRKITELVIPERQKQQLPRNTFVDHVLATFDGRPPVPRNTKRRPIHPSGRS